MDNKYLANKIVERLNSAGYNMKKETWRQVKEILDIELKAIQVQAGVMPNEVVASGSLKEKVAKCLFRIWWNGRPSLEYGFTTLPQGLEGGYLSDKENWDREAEYLIKIITASQREA